MNGKVPDPVGAVTPYGRTESYGGVVWFTKEEEKSLWGLGRWAPRGDHDPNLGALL